MATRRRESLPRHDEPDQAEADDETLGVRLSRLSGLWMPQLWLSEVNAHVLSESESAHRVVYVSVTRSELPRLWARCAPDPWDPMKVLRPHLGGAVACWEYHSPIDPLPIFHSMAENDVRSGDNFRPDLGRTIAGFDLDFKSHQRPATATPFINSVSVSPNPIGQESRPIPTRFELTLRERPEIGGALSRIVSLRNRSRNRKQFRAAIRSKPHNSEAPDVPITALSAGFEAGFRSAGGELQDPEAAYALGLRLGQQAAATTAWRSRIGESIETEDVTQLLGITRQALDSRKRTGSVLALPGPGTSYYPTWQFKSDGTKTTVRPITLRIVTTFREAIEEIEPHMIASWATSPQPELDNQTPAEWITNDGPDEPVILAAERTALLEAL